MPAREKHLPTHFERTALQRLKISKELSARDLEPTTDRTISKLMAKGWIESGSSAGRYRITTAGEAPLITPLPAYRQAPRVRTFGSTKELCGACGTSRHVIARKRLSEQY